MAKTDHVELPGGIQVPILYEDRGVIALDKPAGWMLGPEDEEHARRNLHLALMAGIEEGAWWARCRNLRFIRFVHRLDAPTTGILLMVKSQGAIRPYTELFASREVEKTYLAVTEGVPTEERWRCQLPLGPVPEEPGKHRVDKLEGKEADTGFVRLETRGNRALVEAHPHTGRTHQIRLHLRAAACPVVGDYLYGDPDPAGMALRAVALRYRDPFSGKPVRIRANDLEFRRRFGFGPAAPGTSAVPGASGAQVPKTAAPIDAKNKPAGPAPTGPKPAFKPDAKPRRP